MLLWVAENLNYNMPIVRTVHLWTKECYTLDVRNILSHFVTFVRPT